MANVFITMITFTFVFVFLLGLYGASTNLPQVTGPLQIINGPWPSFFIGNCSAAVFCVNQIADFLKSTGFLLQTFVLKIGAVFALIYGIFLVLNGYSGLPFLGWFFTLMLFILAVSSFQLIRSGHTA